MFVAPNYIFLFIYVFGNAMSSKMTRQVIRNDTGASLVTRNPDTQTRGNRESKINKKTQRS